MIVEHVKKYPMFCKRNSLLVCKLVPLTGREGERNSIPARLTLLPAIGRSAQEARTELFAYISFCRTTETGTVGWCPRCFCSWKVHQYLWLIICLRMLFSRCCTTLCAIVNKNAQPCVCCRHPFFTDAFKYINPTSLRFRGAYSSICTCL